MASSRLQIAWRIVRVALVAVLVVLLMLTFFETPLVYPAPPKETGDWVAAATPHEDVEFQAADGTRLHGWLFEHEQPRHHIVYFHGNGEIVPYNADLMDHLRRELAASVFIIDYRGYGKSEGTPSEAGLIADGLAAQQWMAARYDIEHDEIVLMGRSLGGGVAVAVAAEHGARALVLQSTFGSMVNVAARHFPILPVRLLMRNRYDSAARIAKYEGPVLQSHGDADEVVPIDEGRRLFESIASANKQFIVFPRYGHNDPQPAHYSATLRDFLETLPNSTGDN